MSGHINSVVSMDAKETGDKSPVTTAEEMCGSHSTGVKGSGRLTYH